MLVPLQAFLLDAAVSCSEIVKSVLPLILTKTDKLDICF